MVQGKDRNTYRRDWVFTKVEINNLPTTTRPVKKVVVHHTGVDGQFSRQSWYVIHRHHQRKGWRGIGYHFGVSPEGEVFTLRPVSLVGAHTLGHNADSIGVVVWGNKKKTKKSVEVLAELVAVLCLRYGCPYYFHSDLNPTLCPRLNRKEFDELVAEAKRRLVAGEQK